nr:uncharacterized protein LOC109189836 [Ipomoea batatas]
MHAKTEKRLVDVVPVVAGVWGVVGGPSRQGVGLSDIVDGRSFVTPTEVVPRVGSTFVCLAPRKTNRPACTVLGSVRRCGVHSIAFVPSLDLLDDVNFFKWVLKYGSDDLHEFLFSYSGQIVSRDDICSLAPGAEVFVDEDNASRKAMQGGRGIEGQTRISITETASSASFFYSSPKQ